MGIHGGSPQEKKLKITVHLFGGLIYYHYFRVLLNFKLLDMEFDFSVDFDGEVEDISSYTEVTDTDCETFLKRLLTKKKIGLGERTEGNCKVVNGVVKLDYRVCMELGEDYDSDVWDDIKEDFPLLEI